MKSINILGLMLPISFFLSSLCFSGEVWVNKSQYLNGEVPTIWKHASRFTNLGLNIPLGNKTVSLDQTSYTIPISIFAFSNQVKMSLYENGQFLLSCESLNQGDTLTRACVFNLSRLPGTYSYKVVYHHVERSDTYPYYKCIDGKFWFANFKTCNTTVTSQEFTVTVIKNTLPKIYWLTPEQGKTFNYEPGAEAVNLKVSIQAEDPTPNIENNLPNKVSFFIKYGDDEFQEVGTVKRENSFLKTYNIIIPNVKTGRPITVFARAYDSYEPQYFTDSSQKTITDINRAPTANLLTSKTTYYIDEAVDFTAILSDDSPLNSNYQAHICYQKENEAEHCICYKEEGATDGQCEAGFLASPDSVQDNQSLYRTNKLASLIGAGDNIKIWARVKDPLGKINDPATVTKKTIHITANKEPSVSIQQPYPNAQYREGDLIEILLQASDEDGTIDRIELKYGAKDTVIGCFSVSDSTCNSIEDLGDGQYRFRWYKHQITGITDGAFYVTATDNEGATKTPLALVKTTIIPLGSPPAPNVTFDTVSPDGDGRFTVDWAQTGAERYLVERCDLSIDDCNNPTNAAWVQIRQLDQFQTGIVEAGLPNGDFHYRVTSCAVNYKAHNGEKVLCENTSAVQTMTVVHAAPGFPFLDEYLFEASPQKNSGDYSLTWQTLDEATAGAVVDYYQLHEKSGNYQCKEPDNDGYCESEWLNIDVSAAQIDQANGTMTVHFNNKPLGEGLYSYRLQACNHKSGCTTGPMIEVAILPPLIENVAVACQGSCLQLSGHYFDSGASIHLSAYDGDIEATLLADDVSWQHQGFIEVKIGEDTSFSRAIGDSGMRVTLTNPNGTAFSASLKPNQQSSSIDLTDTDPVISKDLDTLYVTVGDKVHAINLTTGNLIEGSTTGWPFTVPNSQLTTPVVNQIDGHFYVGSTDNNLYAVDNAGFMFWKTETDGQIVAEPSLGETSAIFTGSMDGSLYALHPDDGDIVWQRHTDNSGINQKPRLQGDDFIYVTTTQGQVHLINRRILDQNTLVWKSVDDSLLAYELQVGNWQPSRLYNHDDYLSVAKLYRLILQPELPLNREVLTFWTFALDQRVPLKTVAKAFLEYDIGQSNFPTGAPLGGNDKFLQSLYQRAFGETGKDSKGNIDPNLYRSLIIQGGENPLIYDYSELLRLLDTGTDRADIILLFTQSLEYSQATLGALSAQYDYLYAEDFSWTTNYCGEATCDTDNDGLFDWWEELYFGNITDVSSDTVINGTPVGVNFRRDDHPCGEEKCRELETVPDIQFDNLPTADDADVVASDKVAAIAGEFGVNEAGAATYRVPVMTAPGVAGVAPEMALSYSSQSQNGPVGFGWGISGLSMISRCRQTLGIDGVAKPVTWTNEDRLCLDGQRLIATEGSYLVAGSTYKTEIDSDALVYLKSNGSGLYFEVGRKDGSITTYGAGNNAKQVTSQGVPYVWAMDGFRDSIGSNDDIQFTYLLQNAANKSLMIQKVDYAYGTASDAGAHIEFVYDSNRLDPISGFTGGEWFGSNKRLSEVVSYSDDEEIRRLKLAYKPYSNANPISKLQTVEECVGDNYCKKAKLTFAWTEPRVSFNAPIVSHTDTDDVGIYKYRPADINGDGMMDLIWLQWRYQPQQDDTEHRLQFMLSDGQTLNQTSFYNPDSPSSHYSYIYYDDNVGDETFKIEVIDYNADGRHDALLYREVGNQWFIHLSVLTPDGSWRLSRKQIVISKDSNGIKLPEATQFVDVDSDGLPDAVYIINNKIHVRKLVKKLPVVEGSNVPYHFSPDAETMVNSIAFPALQIPDSTDTTEVKFDLLKQVSNDYNGDGIIDLALEKRTEICDLQTTSKDQTSSYCDYSYQYAFYSLTANNTVELIYHFTATSPKNSPWFDGEQKTVTPACGRRHCSEYAYHITKPPVESPLTFSNGDINNDGLVDLFYTPEKLHKGDAQWFYRLNNGVDFEAPVSVGTYKEKSAVKLTDVNQDGYQDLVWIDGSAKSAFWLPAESRFDLRIVKGKATGGSYSFGRYSQNNGFALLDVNGDAVNDIFVADFGPETFNVSLASQVVADYWENGQLYYRGDRQEGKAHMITAIDNGFGNRTDITYESIAKSTHYADLHTRRRTLEPALMDGDETYVQPSADTESDFYKKLAADLPMHKGHQTLGRENESPIFQLKAPVYVVTDVESSKPSSSASEPGIINKNDKGKISYYYTDAKLQAAGRGMLGFAKVKMLTHDTNILTTNYYRQDFPFSGIAWKTEQKILGGKPLNVSTSTWEIFGWNGDQSPSMLPQPPYRLVSTKSTKASYDFETGTLLKTVEMSNDLFDQSGNVKTSREKIVDHVNNLSFEKVSENTYHPSEQGKRFGRLTESTVTHTRTGQTPIVRQTQFTYYEDSHWMLKDQLVDPGSPLQVKTTYDYDTVGNKWKTTTKGIADIDNTAQERTAHVEFDARGRYPIKTYNSQGQLTEQILERLPSGQVTQVQGANGLIATVLYTRFGRKFYETTETGGFNKMLIGAGGGYYCDANAQYHMKTESADGSQSFICYDVLGREIKSGQLGFNGYEWYVTQTGYDALGRTAYKSFPYTKDIETPKYVTYTYDLYGRAIRSTFPNETMETFDYDLLTVTATNRKGNTRTEQRNALEELIGVEDALGGTITHQYDAVGNLIQSTTNGPVYAAGVTGPITVTIDYDAQGRYKTGMDDPDKGKWRYRNNAFGEVIQQLDARGRSTVTHYDDLGRAVCRNDFLTASHHTVESSSQWFYDTAPKAARNGSPSTAVGLLHRSIKSNTACTAQSAYDSSATVAYEQTFAYDAYGRNHQTTTVIDGEAFDSHVTFDEIGRTFQSFDAAGSDSGTRTLYNSSGYVSEIRDAWVVNSEQKVYRKILEMDARGKVTKELHNNGLTTTRAYDLETGMATEIYSALEGVLTAQDQTLVYDVLGNLETRIDRKRDKTESFCYDALNRMTSSAIDADCAAGVAIEYDSFGNFIKKPNAGTYHYGENAGPHAVTSVEKDGQTTTFVYDANGNMTSDSLGRSLVYSQFDKPTFIKKGVNEIRFDYGPGRARYKRVDSDGDSTTRTYYLGNVEIIDRDGVREAKRYISGNTLITETTQTNPPAGEGSSSASIKLQFMFKDHLGSLDIILGENPTAADGQTLMSFDAWGLRRNATTLEDGFDLSTVLNQIMNTTTRGFTGHEMLDAVGLIHMNGRVYDALLGRFLSADPFIQAPTETQSFNRYAYVWNNPMSATDPSGYWNNAKMWGEIGKVFQVIGSIVMAASGGNPIIFAIGAAFYIVGSFGVGESQNNGAKGAFTGAIMVVASYVTAGVANGLASGASGAVTGTTIAATAAQIGISVAIHAAVGGMLSYAQGGNFWKGAAASGLGALARGVLPTEGAGGFLISAAVGGTASRITGGKFANGAITAAFAYAARAAASSGGASEDPYANEPMPENYSDFKYRTTGQEVVAMNDAFQCTATCVRDNRFDLEATLATAVGAGAGAPIPKTQQELRRGSATTNSNVSKNTTRLSRSGLKLRQSARGTPYFKATRLPSAALRWAGRAAGAVAVPALIAEGFYDIGVIGYCTVTCN